MRLLLKYNQKTNDFLLNSIYQNLIVHSKHEVHAGKSLELPYGVGIVGKVGNESGRTQSNPTPSLLDKLYVKFI